MTGNTSDRASPYGGPYGQAMSISQQKRIERLEDFVERLTLGSHFAKAAASGTAMIGHDLEPGDADLASAATNDPKRLNGVENRVQKLEKKVDSLYNDLGEHMVSAHHRQADTGEQAALNTLAKAQNAVRRNMTPDGLLERGLRVLTDPTAVGVLESYINGGQLKKAADLLANAEARADKNDDDDALERVESQIKEHEVLASVSQLGEQVADLQHTLNSLLSRISKLESRSVAAPAPAQAVVKGAQFGRRSAQETDAANSVQGLQSRLEAVFDSPAQVGTLSSMLQAGRIDEVRAAVERAEVRHESDMRKRDRRSL